MLSGIAFCLSEKRIKYEREQQKNDNNRLTLCGKETGELSLLQLSRQRNDGQCEAVILLILSV